MIKKLFDKKREMEHKVFIWTSKNRLNIFKVFEDIGIYLNFFISIVDILFLLLVFKIILTDVILPIKQSFLTVTYIFITSDIIIKMGWYPYNIIKNLK